MAAFSYSHHPFLLDSVFLPNTPIMMSGFMDDANLNTNNCFSQFYPTSQHETSCVLDRSSKVALSDNERSMTKKQSNTESSSVVDKLESGEQVTQKLPIMEKKRRSRNGSSLSSAVSKEPRENKGKKQKKCNDAQKDEGKKLKFDKNSQAKAEEEPASRDYIHVRARRGQATDSHSLAERVRREKISERMKMLQKLVPGCDKVTGKALMLDEIINYVQSLQNQVEFLSMKLASVNPMFYDFGMDLDSFMGRPERLSSMALPIPSVPQCGPTQPTAFADTLPAASFTTATNYPPMENSAAPLLLQHEQSSNAFCHVHDSDFTMDNGNLLWDMEDQKLNFLNPSGFSNNLCSFN